MMVILHNLSSVVYDWQCHDKTCPTCSDASWFSALSELPLSFPFMKVQVFVLILSSIIFFFFKKSVPEGNIKERRMVVITSSI